MVRLICGTRNPILAAAQGQKIYTLNAKNQANHAAILAQIQIDADARAEIQNALNAGKEVTVHQSPVSVGGWTGSGYTIIDPDTGAGAYKISGGANGGWLALQGLFGGFLLVASLLLAISGFGTLLGLLSLILAVELIVLTLQNALLENAGCYFAGFAAGASAVSMFLEGLTLKGNIFFWMLGVILGYPARAIA